MECLLCDIWARMPYAKRPTTPTSAQETEGALIVGYWITSRCDSVPRMCERHMAVLTALDQQEEQRVANEHKIQEQTIAHDTRHVYPIAPSQVQPQPTTETFGFQLGPGPLANENTASAHIPIGANDLAAPYRKKEVRHVDARNRIKPAIAVPILEPQPDATTEPVDGGKFTHPCPLCGKTVASGEVHSC